MFSSSSPAEGSFEKRGGCATPFQSSNRRGAAVLALNSLRKYNKFDEGQKIVLSVVAVPLELLEVLLECRRLWRCQVIPETLYFDV